MADERLTTTDRFRKGLDEFLGTTGAGLEEVVNTKAFGDILSQVTGNLVAVSRISGETLDLVIRNARLAGRKDVAELGRQLGRTEDKLEAVLALVEDLQSDLRAAREENAALRGEAAENPAPARKSTARKSSTED
ncbi:hypothetical protein AADG42_10240 [Ammonicoccus fulvus]|uniref:Uncharacterized protein n=1 Tax=Ammonicoccus fulvus TaxID=3138240 RepID=A0ABZ3FSG7_9ACTN